MNVSILTVFIIYYYLYLINYYSQKSTIVENQFLNWKLNVHIGIQAHLHIFYMYFRSKYAYMSVLICSYVSVCIVLIWHMYRVRAVAVTRPDLWPAVYVCQSNINRLELPPTTRYILRSIVLVFGVRSRDSQYSDRKIPIVHLFTRAGLIEIQ